MTIGAIVTAVLAMMVVVAVALVAAGLLIFGDAGRLGVAGTLLGGVLGYLTATLAERDRRRHEDAHRFEQERRALYVRFLGAITDAEKVVRDRNVTLAAYRQLGREPRHVPDRPDMEPIRMLAEEIELLAPFGVHAAATILRYSLDTLNESVEADDAKWRDQSGDLVRRRHQFLTAAKADLGTPTGIASRWTMVRYRMRKGVREVWRRIRRRPRPIFPF